MDTIDQPPPEDRPIPTPEWKPQEARSTRLKAVILIAAYAAAALLYRGIIANNLGRTAIMFIGLPLLLAAMLASAPPARTSTGSIMKGITLFLLLVAPLMGEGYLCILIASPLFYLVGAIVATVVNIMRERRNDRLGAYALLLLPFAFEGTIPMLTYQREETAEATRVISATPDAVEQALTAPPRIDLAMPRLLRIGFPRPTLATGQGLTIGSTRTLHFTGAETAPPGDLTAQVTASRPGYAGFTITSDHTKVTEWMHWRASEVSWQAVDATHTQVTWRIHYTRGLDPAWYFGPWERVVVTRCADYLITASATRQAQ